LKLKVGQHEFEAEGEQETVERQLAVWRDLIASPSAVQPPASAPPPPAVTPAPTEGQSAFGPLVDDRAFYDRLFHHRGPVVSLTVLPTGPQREADAALLLLLGQKVYNGDQPVTGGRLLEGLKLSGLSVERVDRVWGPHTDSNVIRAGAKRGVKYRLTHPGNARATEIAKELLSKLP
jgi:hypothetical protein